MLAYSEETQEIIDAYINLAVAQDVIDRLRMANPTDNSVQLDCDRVQSEIETACRELHVLREEIANSN